MNGEGLSGSINFGNLVRASDALDWLAPRLRSHTLAKLELADAMRDARIRCFALRAWDTTERVLRKAWAYEPEADDEETDLEEDLEVLAWVWRQSRRWQVDQSDWRWPSGRFTSVVSTAPFRRVLVEHVHFDRQEIIELASHLLDNRLTAVRPRLVSELSSDEGEIDDMSSAWGNGDGLDPKGVSDQSWIEEMKKIGAGRPINGLAWAAIIMKAYDLKSKHEFQKPEYRLQKTLIQDFIIAAQDHGRLGATKIKPVVSALYASGFVDCDRAQEGDGPD